ncbi:hypothetical protein [Arenibaculum pallidiluteum]|uniref:hypothetical protein n=1 Tax=Arenibaculum pallidiluteum TaxID=2812559 RepID=UPI001A9659E6|nr:hypothetical protein [Arenibaculum pallidiluteum]
MATRDAVGGDGIREVVALFESRAAFDRAVEGLLVAGFTRADLSVLSSHESLDAAGRPAKPADQALAAMVGELSYAFPLTTAGLFAIVGGPITAAVAAAVAAGVGGAAVKEYLDQVTAKPHTEDFARALEAGGVILWARVGRDAAREEAARRALAAAGGRNVHLVERNEQSA